MWGSCSASCGGGFRERRRSCMNFLFSGLYCQGNGTELESCNEQVKYLYINGLEVVQFHVQH